MGQAEVINKTRKHLKEKFSTESSGHDFWHMERVWRTARFIAGQENEADGFIVELAALLHDIADWKFHNGDEEAGPREATKWLERLGVDGETITHVAHIIRNVSFKGAGIKTGIDTLEGKIVHDADKLDAIGAIGIARTFAYGGSTGRSIHNPDRKPQIYSNAEAYKNNSSPSINHFYEKLLLLRDIMMTDTGRQLAQQRHDFMVQFLAQFHSEWNAQT